MPNLRDALRKNRCRTMFKLIVQESFRRCYGIEAEDGPFAFHQLVMWNGLRAMLVVPWPDRASWAVNCRDVFQLEEGLADVILFARFTGAWQCDNPTIEVVSLTADTSKLASESKVLGTPLCFVPTRSYVESLGGL